LSISLKVFIYSTNKKHIDELISMLVALHFQT
jgi:hypothetical protein